MIGVFFSYSPDYGFELFSTQEDAKANAQASIDEYRENIEDPDEWNDDVSRVCWGSVSEIATPHHAGDGYADYELKGVRK